MKVSELISCLGRCDQDLEVVFSSPMSVVSIVEEGPVVANVKFLEANPITLREVVKLSGTDRLQEIEEEEAEKDERSVLITCPDTGPCEIDVQAVVDRWDDTWFLSQWKMHEFRLVHGDAPVSDIIRLKVTISEEQAKELIAELNLKSERSPVFASAATWRSKVE